MAKPQLRLYFDIVSPFAYLAFHVVNTSAVFADCEITLIPALLGGIMKECGNSPPFTIKNKGEWSNLDRQRWVKAYSIPMADDMPPSFPARTLSVQRHLSALSALSPSHLSPAVRALFTRLFLHHLPISDPADFLPVLLSTLGPELSAQVEQQAATLGKEVLNRNTADAVQGGAFGMPWFVCTDREGRTESFWGFDHLGMVVGFLGLDRGKGEGGWRSML